MTDIYNLSDRALELLCDADPMLATEVGVAGRDHRWPDLSPSGHDRRAALVDELHNQAAAMVTTTPSEEVAKRVLLDDLASQQLLHQSGAHLYDLNNIASPFQGIKQTFDLMAKDTLDDWARLLVRLETIAEPITGYRASLTRGLVDGMAVAQRQVTAVIAEGETTARASSPLNGIVEAFDGTGIGDEGMRNRLVAAVEGARTAYGELTEWLRQDYLPHAREDDGVGVERYQVELQRYLGMSIDIAETYRWGWDEIGRLWNRLVALCEQISPGVDVQGTVEQLDADPALACADPDAFIEQMRVVQHEALENLAGTHFDVPDPIRSVAVKIAPAGGALAPYYTGPSEDFSRPGVVWYPLGDRTRFPLWGEITTAYHEGFPGHHLQVGVQVALGDKLSRYHRVMVWQPGSGEGWALYAENLMNELGYLELPQYEVGFLTAQIMRACRVVIDIGAHCGLPIPDDVDFHPGERWSFELAVAMLQDIALQPEEMATSEVTRYFGWPGQAISYKVGEKVILDLRDELSRRPDFDLKTFHTSVLEVGSIGLDLLQELVRAHTPS